MRSPLRVDGGAIAFHLEGTAIFWSPGLRDFPARVEVVTDDPSNEGEAIVVGYEVN
ncbi:hypothetical protein H6F90_12150 [Trichocoleus sp. FACHB-591]|uniref:hypothetical protein n=1 Tax=Trichocoleus sp. FACHB-591 TaxID=2692872 RepID=UPI001684916C|nr:hypothetical protein [Trichocoleus sp. FACHB-591]MBD2095899.1 hypothetical protein [Trichocoleus sp. FACHB-591]